MVMYYLFILFKLEDIYLLDINFVVVCVNVYDMVINGVEVGGGLICIYDSQLQNKMFELFGFILECV